MKFFKKRLNKRKLTKSLTEETTAHQHNHNKPSPSLVSMPQQAPTASVEAATNSDSWLELNLPNDFSSSLDIPPQLQTKATPLVQESENITGETSLFSYPDNHIDTTTRDDEEPNKPDEEEESVVVSVAATLSSSSARPDSVDRDDQQDESPLQQPVEKQGDTLLNDTCRDAIVLVNATLIPTDAMQHIMEELEEADDLSSERESSAQEEQAAVEMDVFLAATTVSMVADTVIEPGGGDNAEETQPLDSSIPTDKDTLEIASPVEMSNSTIDNENLDDLQIASPTPFSPPPLLLATEEEPSSAQAACSTEESSSLQDSQGDTFKIAKRKSAISLIPRSSKQQQSTDANVKKDGSRRASSSSFIPVLATRHQHAASVCVMPSKDAALATTVVPVTTWSPSSSSERNSVSSSSDSASSCGSRQHQEKRTSLIAKSSATHQQQLLVLQSKIPKASFGMPLTANTEISKAVPTTTAQQQQHVSRLPTKRNSTLA